MKYLLGLLFATVAFAQPQGGIPVTFQDPTGHACNGGGAVIYAPSGAFFTCQSGLLAQISGGSGTFVTLSGDATSTATGGTTVVHGVNSVLFSSLATGILKNTTTTGVPSIAIAADFPTLNQSTTGTAAGLSATLVLGSGGTNQTAWTPGDCIQVNSGGTALESAGAPCGSGGGGTGTVTNSTPLTATYDVLGNGGVDTVAGTCYEDVSNIKNCAGFATTGTASGILTLSGSTSGTVTQTVNAVAGTWTFKWPAAAAAAHQWLTTDTGGIGSFTQPAFGDLTGSWVAAQAPATSAGDVTNSAGSTTKTVVGINGVPLCTGFTPTTLQVLQYTTASSPNPCYTAATVSGGTFDPIDPSTVYVQEHFLTGDTTSARIGVTGSSNVAITTAATASYVIVAGHPGVLRLATDTTIDHGSVLVLGPAGGTSLDAGMTSTKDWDAYSVFAMGTNSTTISGVGMNAGIGNVSGTTGSGTLGINVRYITSLSTPDTNLMMVVCNASGSAGCDTVTPGTNANASLVDSGITPAAGTWYQVHQWHRMSGVGGLETIYMSINGAVSAPGYKTFCSSGCDGIISHQPTTGGVAVHVMYFNHAGTVAKDIDVDYMAFKMTGMQLY